MDTIWTKEAKRDIKDFLSNIHRGTEKSANNYIYKLVQYIRILKEFPQAGRLIDKIDKIEIRQLVYKRHKIFYKIDTKVYILSVIHSSKKFDYQKDLKTNLF